MPQMKRTRLGHKKSKNGCTHCKSRHVKCDEQRPCSSCKRYGMECSLVAAVAKNTEFQWHSSNFGGAEPSYYTDPVSRTISGASADDTFQQHFVVPILNDRTTTSLPHSALQQNPLQSLKAKIASGRKIFNELEEELKGLDHRQPGPETNTPISDLIETGPSDWLKDLQLLKHYLTSTYPSLCQDDRLAPLWRDVIPDCAFSHDYLMHGLLAVSALHFGHTHPSQTETYGLLSARHQAIALNWFSSQLHNINQENYKAHVFLGSIVFMFPVFAVADAGRVGRVVETHEIVQSFVLLRGVKSIMDNPPTPQWMAAADFGPLLAVSVPSNDGPATGEFVRRLEAAHGAIHRIAAERGDAAETLEVCGAAVEGLRETYTRVMAPGTMADGVWLWPLVLPEAFMLLIVEGHPAALTVLAHFAALMRRFEVYWWNEGWSESVVNMVIERLGVEGSKWVEWPVKCVREGIDVRKKD